MISVSTFIQNERNMKQETKTLFVKSDVCFKNYNNKSERATINKRKKNDNCIVELGLRKQKL